MARSKKYNPNKNYYEEDLSDYADEEDDDYDYEDEEDYDYRDERPVRKSSKKSSKNNMKKKNKRKNNAAKKIIIAMIVVLIGVGGVALGASKLFNSNNSSGTSDNTEDSKPFDVPNFVGISIDDASRQAAKLNLNIQQSEEYSKDVKKGYIISQTPNTGEVEKGDTINVVVSLGGKEAIVPNCVGISYEKAKKLIEKNNLKVGSRSYEYSSVYEEGVVTWQNPSPGTSGILENTTVDLIISKGKKPQQNNNNNDNTDTPEEPDNPEEPDTPDDPSDTDNPDNPDTPENPDDNNNSSQGSGASNNPVDVTENIKENDEE